MSADTLLRQVPIFRKNAQRWVQEIDAMQDRRTTAFYGIMARACEELDIILTAAAHHSLAITDLASSDSVLKITAGKPFDKLTMGQCVQLLIILRPALNNTLAHAPGSNEQPFPKQLVALLQTLSRNRNDFAHRRFPRNCANRGDMEEYIRAATAGTHDFLADGLRMTEFPLLSRLAAMTVAKPTPSKACEAKSDNVPSAIEP